MIRLLRYLHRQLLNYFIWKVNAITKYFQHVKDEDIGLGHLVVGAENHLGTDEFLLLGERVGVLDLGELGEGVGFGLVDLL